MRHGDWHPLKKCDKVPRNRHCCDMTAVSKPSYEDVIDPREGLMKWPPSRTRPNPDQSDPQAEDPQIEDERCVKCWDLVLDLSSNTWVAKSKAR